MTDAINIHASCVQLNDVGKSFDAPAHCGVLLLGESGSGKSDLALRLIALGARLVSDDRTDLFVEGSVLAARAPASLTGLIEVRGVGIVALPFAIQTRIVLAVQLVENCDVPRMPEKEFYAPPPELTLPPASRPPLIRLCARDASATARISLAAAAFAKGLFRETRNP